MKKNTKIQNNQCINKNTGRVISAIIPVHVFGFIGDMILLKKIADEFKISIIEDSTEALGSFKNNQHAGNSITGMGSPFPLFRTRPPAMIKTREMSSEARRLMVPGIRGLRKLVGNQR